MSKSLPLLYTIGTYYEVGYSIGSTFAERINRFWSESQNLIRCELPFYETPRGQDYFNTALKVCEMYFPQYIQEIKGMADGAKMPFDRLFKLNISKKVRNISKNFPFAYKERSGCTDIYLNTPTVKILAHNEDCDFKIDTYGYMVSVRIVDDKSGTELENFTAFCYPGELPGTAIALNRHGMVFTAEHVIETATPRLFVNRSLMKAHCIDEVIELIKNPGYGVAIGFSLNVVDIKNPTCMWSEGLPPPSNKHEVKCLLGDQGNKEYPIYRTKCPPDRLATALTAIVDVNKKQNRLLLRKPKQRKSRALISSQCFGFMIAIFFVGSDCMADVYTPDLDYFLPQFQNSECFLSFNLSLCFHCFLHHDVSSCSLQIPSVFSNFN
ncbi:acyl-coenzyme A:6-aminopenicillanic-acid-acyltransferase 40 kDa form [Biomphalaria pfeifferi]|uniref:Acyl-coenzyme A:6-aminopenicillanic-acid-acyltransferase 40 kDa form n=1 Tax=Biomphalaria pfeifferi TaxID=112525 RepID=A0AAD8AX34_BIOPF|nr:acyl-coenzyme A:6-aminopenicillanic-acid-acyltransferase 40 kDa form [Biomphalaria pfeifferi]